MLRFIKISWPSLVSYSIHFSQICHWHRWRQLPAQSKLLKITRLLYLIRQTYHHSEWNTKLFLRNNYSMLLTLQFKPFPPRPPNTLYMGSANWTTRPLAKAIMKGLVPQCKLKSANTASCHFNQLSLSLSLTCTLTNWYGEQQRQKTSHTEKKPSLLFTAIATTTHQYNGQSLT